MIREEGYGYERGVGINNFIPIIYLTWEPYAAITMNHSVYVLSLAVPVTEASYL